MNINLIILLILLFILITFFKRDTFLQETASYLGKIITNDDVTCNKNLYVNDTTTTNKLCLDTVCINKNQLDFIKKLPVELKESVCIGETCLNETDLRRINSLDIDKINYIEQQIPILRQKLDNLQKYSNKVVLYTESNFQGNKGVFEVGNYNIHDMISKGIANDTVSSIKVPPGLKLILYTHSNFIGSYEFTEGNYNREQLESKGVGDNAVSSLKVMIN